MTEPEVTSDSPLRGRSGRVSWIVAILIGVISGTYFGIHLGSEPDFVDEWAYISQTYYAPLFLDGSRDHPAWLEYPAYDLPPLPKYVIGASLSWAGYRLPGPRDAITWYQNTKSKFGPPAMLIPARIPSVIFGLIGCVALYGIGTLALNRTTGVLAAFLLMINPLYRMHARRAMSDVVAESLIILTVFFALWVWIRLLKGKNGWPTWIGAGFAGVLSAGAVLAKLNGGLAIIFIVGATFLGLLLPRVPNPRKLNLIAASLLAGLASLVTFVAFNPFITAHPRQKSAAIPANIMGMKPWERALYLVKFRASVSSGQQELFPHNALKTTSEKWKTVAVQGYGRFGPIGPEHSDSTRRYDKAQDSGAAVWLPLVLAGAYLTWRRGKQQLREGEPPAAWVVLANFVLATLVVASYLPLAWDRYFLSLQPWSTLLGATALAQFVGLTAKAFQGMKT